MVGAIAKSLWTRDDKGIEQNINVGDDFGVREKGKAKVIRKIQVTRM